MNGKLLVYAELPGLKKGDIKVQVTEDALILEGERKQEKEEKREGYYHSERSYGHFYRSIPLPEGVTLDKASAEFTNGILEVTIPVAETKQKLARFPCQKAGRLRPPVVNIRGGGSQFMGPRLFCLPDAVSSCQTAMITYRTTSPVMTTC